MKLSVAVVTYNQRDTIHQAVASALSQQVDFDHEIVVGDDASTDGTREVLHALQREAPERVRLILRDSRAGDLGKTNFIETLLACSGEYVALLDGDDYWTDPNKLARQVALLDHHPECAICGHRVLHLRDDGIEIPSARPRRGGGFYGIEELLRHNFLPKLSVVYRRSACPELPQRWVEAQNTGNTDRSLHLLHANGGRIAFIDEVMGVHRVSAGGVSSRFGWPGMLRRNLDMYEALKPELPRHRAAIEAAIRRTRLKLAFATLVPMGSGIKTLARRWLRRVS